MSTSAAARACAAVLQETNAEAGAIRRTFDEAGNVAITKLRWIAAGTRRDWVQRGEWIVGDFRSRRGHADMSVDLPAFGRT
jgi:hypothetical protein